jgi:ribosomal protein S18 acetylase RimI-like enzyme
MTDAPSIRPAQEPDLPSLVELLRQLFALEPDFKADPERQRRGLGLLLAAPERAVVLVAERAGKVIGMVTGQLVISTAEGAPSAWLEDMVVGAAERGRGTGPLLLDALQAWAIRRGATRLQLLADRENAPALRFYEKARWQPTRMICLRKARL